MNDFFTFTIPFLEIAGRCVNEYYGGGLSKKTKMYQLWDTSHVTNLTNPYNSLCQGCQRFETSVFFSVKINISTTGGFRVGFFQPDTNHP